MSAVVRTLEEANAILREEGALSWIGLEDEQQLGCTVAEQHEWLTTDSEAEIRSWARSVAGDEAQP